MDEKGTQDHVAQYYPKRYKGNGRLFHEYAVYEMLGREELTQESILDIGCGIGFISEVFPRLDILGIDFSHEMIKRNPYLCEIGNAEGINHDDGTFDFIICRGVLHHLNDIHLGLSEMTRVLKTGGRIVFLETHETVVTWLPRKLLKLTHHFSGQHVNFNEEFLTNRIEEHLSITSIEYLGYLAYPLIGFPDIVSIPLPKRVAQWLIKLDARLARSGLKKLGFNLLIKAQKG